MALPILYHRDDCCALFFAAALDRVRAALPSERLHPVRLGSRRAAVAVAAFNYLETTIGPYGEVGVVVPVVYGRRPPPLLPALLESTYPGFGLFVLHLPVTTRVARDAGRGAWGYPKFLADMRFEITPDYQQCQLSEAGEHLLTLRVARGGWFRRDRRPIVTYSVRDRELVRTVIPQRGTWRGRIGGGVSALELGSHPLAQSIRELGLSARPLLSRYYVERSAVLPAGEVVETGLTPYGGYLGGEQEGVLTVAYGA